mgnify:CR=1 FL=1
MQSVVILRSLGKFDSVCWRTRAIWSNSLGLGSWRRSLLKAGNLFMTAQILGSLDDGARLWAQQVLLATCHYTNLGVRQSAVTPIPATSNIAEFIVLCADDG